MKRVAKWIGMILGILVLVVLVQFGWGIYREPIAKQEAVDFCATIVSKRQRHLAPGQNS